MNKYFQTKAAIALSLGIIFGSVISAGAQSIGSSSGIDGFTSVGTGPVMRQTGYGAASGTSNSVAGNYETTGGSFWNRSNSAAVGNAYGTAADTWITRQAAGVLGVGTAAGGLQGSMRMTSIQLENAGGVIQKDSTAAARTIMNLTAGNVLEINNGAAGTIDFFSTGTTRQFQIIHTASANRYWTLSGSNAGNPTLTVNGGNLKLGAARGVLIGANTDLTLTAGAFGVDKITSSASAPGAGGAKFEVVCGTNAGTAKLQMYAGTSATPVTVIDNVGAGVTGC